MKVILQKDIKNLGSKGDVKEVKDGYAHNFLFPKGLALEASKGRIAELEQQAKNRENTQKKAQEQAEKLAEKINKTKLTLSAKTGEMGKLFGSITSKDIAKELQKKGIKVDKKKINLSEPLKSLGKYQIEIKLHPQVSVNININVVEEKGE